MINKQTVTGKCETPDTISNKYTYKKVERPEKDKRNTIIQNPVSDYWRISLIYAKDDKGNNKFIVKFISEYTREYDETELVFDESEFVRRSDQDNIKVKLSEKGLIDDNMFKVIKDYIYDLKRTKQYSIQLTEKTKRLGELLVAHKDFCKKVNDNRKSFANNREQFNPEQHLGVLESNCKETDSSVVIVNRESLEQLLDIFNIPNINKFLREWKNGGILLSGNNKNSLQKRYRTKELEGSYYVIKFKQDVAQNA